MSGTKKGNIGLFATVILGIFFIPVNLSAGDPVYYFANTINNDSTELGNYWNDSGLTDPAVQLPDLSTTDQLVVVAGATYVGDPIFNGGDGVNYGTISGNAVFKDLSQNAVGGTVNGNAVFVGDSSENNGTVTGTKTRRYTNTVNVTRDFVTDGPWIVVADGVEIEMVDALYNNNTIFSEINGGSFNFINLSSIQSYSTSITLSYDRNLDVDSIPSASDYIVSVNGNLTTISNIQIVTNKVILTVVSNITSSDQVIVSYIPGDNPVQNEEEKPVMQIDQQDAIFLIPVEIYPRYMLAVGTLVYAPILNTGKVFVIDTETDTVATTINVAGLFASAVGEKVYLVDNSGNVTILNSNNQSVLGVIDIGIGGGHTIVAGTNLYVSNPDEDQIAVIDTNTDSIIAVINVINLPHSLTVVGTKLYVSSFIGSSISVIDTVTNTFLYNISVGSSPQYSVAVGTKLYVENSSSGTVSVIDTITDTVLSTISVGGAYHLVAVGNKIYVNGGNNPNMFVIDTNTDSISTTISIPTAGVNYSVVIEDKVFVTNFDGNIVSVIDTNTDTLVDNVNTGVAPFYITANNAKIYMSNDSRGTISAIDTTTIPSLLPNLTHFSTTTASGAYASGTSIPITAHFGRSLQAGSSMTVKLSTGDTITLDQVSGSTLTGTYTIGAGDTTSDLFIRQIISPTSVTDSTGTYTRTAYDLPSSVGDFDGENSFIARNLGDAKNISINITPETITVGDNPYQISTSIGGFIYVANQGSNDVSVINATTGEVVDTIDVGEEPYGLANVGTKLYVANIDTDNVSVIDTTTNTVTDTISVGVKPYYVAVVGTKVYVTNGASNSVSVIDSTTDTVSDTISVGSYPRGIKAYGTDLYVANYGDPNYSGGNYISVIDSTTDTVSDTIILPAGSDGPRGVNVLGDKVYVTNFRSHNVSVIDPTTNTIVDTIDVGVGPRGIAGTGTTLYVENFDDSTISVIDTLTNTVTDTIDVGSSPSGITIIGTDAYITSFQDNLVYKLNTTTNELYSGAFNEAEEEVPTVQYSLGGTAAPQPVICPPDALFSPLTGKRCTSFTPTTTPTPSIPSPFLFTKLLKPGMTDPEVQKLQAYLNSHNFPVSLTGAGSRGLESTYFGPKTKSAVIKFQLANNLKGDGVVGPLTRAVMK